MERESDDSRKHSASSSSSSRSKSAIRPVRPPRASTPRGTTPPSISNAAIVTETELASLPLKNALPRSIRHVTNLSESNSNSDSSRNHDSDSSFTKLDDVNAERRPRDDSFTIVRSESSSGTIVPTNYDIFNNYLEESTSFDNDLNQHALEQLLSSEREAGGRDEFGFQNKISPKEGYLPPVLVLPPSPERVGRVDNINHSRTIHESKLRAREDSNSNGSGSNYSGEEEERGITTLHNRISVDGSAWDGILTPTTEETETGSGYDEQEGISPTTIKIDHSYTAMSPPVIPQPLSSPESQYIDLVPRFIETSDRSSGANRRGSSGTSKSDYTTKSGFTENASSSGRTERKRSEESIKTPVSTNFGVKAKASAIFSANYSPVPSPIPSPITSPIVSPTTVSIPLSKRPSLTPKDLSTTTEAPLRFLDGPTPSWLMEPYHLTGKASPSVSVDQSQFSPSMQSNGSRSSSRTSSRGALNGEGGWGSPGYYSAQSNNGYDSGIAPASENSPEMQQIYFDSYRAAESTLPKQVSMPMELNATVLGKSRLSLEQLKEKSPRRKERALDPPPLRGIKSERRRSSGITNSLIAKVSASELSSNDNGNYGSAEEGSISGGLSESEDGPAIPAQLSASDFVDAYGAFNNSPSPSIVDLPTPEEIQILPDERNYVRPNSTHHTRTSSLPFTGLAPPSDIRLDLPDADRRHSRSSSTDMMDDLDAQIEEAMANFAHHGITPSSPTGPSPLPSPALIRVTDGTIEPSHSMYSLEEDEPRRPSLLSCHSEEEIYHDLNSSREFGSSPDWNRNTSPRSAQFENQPIALDRNTSSFKKLKSRTNSIDTSVQELEANTEVEASEVTPKAELFPSTISLLQDLRSSSASPSRLDAKARATAFVEDLRKARALAATEEILERTGGKTLREARRHSGDAINGGGMRRGSGESVSLRKGSGGELGSTRRGSQDVAIAEEGHESTRTRTRTVESTASTILEPKPARQSIEVVVQASLSLADTLSIPGLNVSTEMSSNIRSQSAPPTATSEGFTISSPHSISTEPEKERGGLDMSSLIRTRALPECARYKPIRKIKTARLRSEAYAIRINAFSHKDSGITMMLNIMSGNCGSSISFSMSSPAQSQTHHSRDDPSVLFPMRKDSSKATQINRGSFNSSDLVPSVPYPGVLTNNRYLPSSVIRPKNLLNFSLGRKSSKRMAPSVNASIITSPIGTSPNKNVSNIRTPSASMNSISSSSRQSTLGGPRPQNPTATDDFFVELSSLDELQALIPQGRKEDLVEALRRSNGVVVSAVNIWVVEFGKN